MKEPAALSRTPRPSTEPSADRLVAARRRLIGIFSIASAGFVGLLFVTEAIRDESLVVRSAYGGLLVLLSAAFVLRRRHVAWAGALASLGPFLLVTLLTQEHGGIHSPSGVAAYVTLVATAGILWSALGAFVVAGLSSSAVGWLVSSSTAPLPMAPWQIWAELTFQFVLVALLAHAALRLVAHASLERAAHRRALDALEQRLEESHSVEALGRLAGGVAHDFNNLLTVILGTTELLESAREKHPEIREDLERIEDAATKAALVTSQLLSVGRKQVLSPTVVRPSDLLERLLPLLRRLLPPGIELLVATDPVGSILVDAPRLEHALINLVTNAVQAMHGQGRVRIAMANQPGLDTAPAGAVEIAVEDEGEGMSEEVRQRILEPFFTTKPHGVGTGLGLAMVDGFVQQCGGQLLVESELGVGSRFIMRFPEVANAPHPKEASATRREPQERKRVLLVEPAPDVRLAAKRLLEALGHEVVPAAGLTDIREILSTGDGNFDAMITALTLHDGTVRDLLEGAREKIPNLPVVYVEGSPEETALESFGSGPREARLLKPLSRQSLHDGLASLLKEA